MDAAIKAEWVKRLRSGDYEQVAGYLKKKDYDSGEYRYCCWGVLCEIAVEAGIVDEHDRDGEVYFGKERTDSAMPVGLVYDWAKLSSSPEIQVVNPLYHGDREDSDWDEDYIEPEFTSSTLEDQNDTGHDFLEIADYIEAQL